MAGKRKRSRKASARDLAEAASGKASARDRAEAGMGLFKKRTIGKQLGSKGRKRKKR